MTKDPNHEILGNQRTIYEAVKAFIKETLLVKFGVITFEENSTDKLAMLQLWSHRYLKALLW
jgi:hypothetical protein